MTERTDSSRREAALLILLLVAMIWSLGPARLAQARIPGASTLVTEEITVTGTAIELKPSTGENFSSVSCVSETTATAFCVGGTAATTTSDIGACYSASSDRGAVMSMDVGHLWVVGSSSEVLDCAFGVD